MLKSLRNTITLKIYVVFLLFKDFVRQFFYEYDPIVVFALTAYETANYLP